MQNYRILSESQPFEASPPTAPEAHETSEVSNDDENPIESVQPSVSEVVFSLDPDGIYLSPQTLQLSCATSGARVRYALGVDSVKPDDSIFDPAQPLTLTQSTQVVAQAFLEDAVGPQSVVQYIIKGAVWQKREPEDQSDPTPHEIQSETTLENGWQFAAASVRGKLHAHRALWREDAFAFAQGAKWSAVIVSDGAGSASLSRVGSNRVCQRVQEFLLSTLANWQPQSVEETGLRAEELPQLREHLAEAARQALRDLEAEATKRERPLQDFAATLLILLQSSWQGKQLFAALQVGDGAIALYNTRQEVTLLGQADHGEHSSETRFLTTSGVEADLLNRVSFAIRGDVDAIAVMTDGVSDDFFPEEKRLGELFAALLPQLKASDSSGQTVLHWLGYEKKGSSDDRTLALCWQTNRDAALSEIAPEVGKEVGTASQ